MQLIENFEPVPPLQNRKNIENFVDQSLLGDWVIRVEYSGKNPQGEIDWVQWGPTMFAIKSSCDVMKEIDACHANYPAKEIRIYAEKVLPEMRMAYSVYRPVELGINDKVSESIAAEAANQEWPRSGGETLPVKAKANSTWRYLAAAGTLAGTLIVWEVASS